MYKDKLKNIGQVHSYGANDTKKISSIEKILSIIPPSFEKYLKEIGAGGVPRFDILGTGLHPSGKSAFELANERIKNQDKKLPEDYFLIMDIGDDISWYLDLSSRKKNGECKVRGWITGLDRDEQPDWLKEEETYDSFAEFFKAKVIDSQEDRPKTILK